MEEPNYRYYEDGHDILSTLIEKDKSQKEYCASIDGASFHSQTIHIKNTVSFNRCNFFATRFGNMGSTHRSFFYFCAIFSGKNNLFTKCVFRECNIFGNNDYEDCIFISCSFRDKFKKEASCKYYSCTELSSLNRQIIENSK